MAGAKAKILARAGKQVFQAQIDLRWQERRWRYSPLTGRMPG
jgi:hypothetical protein